MTGCSFDILDARGESTMKKIVKEDSKIFDLSKVENKKLKDNTYSELKLGSSKETDLEQL